MSLIRLIERGGREGGREGRGKQGYQLGYEGEM